MSTRPTSRIGGYGALSIALCTGLLLILLVLGTRLSSGEEPVVWTHVPASYLLAIIGLSGLAAVPAITARVAAADRELSRWAATLAGIGFGLLAVTSFWQAEYEMNLLADAVGMPHAYGESDAGTPSLLLQIAQRLPTGWLELAGTGFWMLCIDRLARRTGAFPAGVLRLGRVAGVVAIATPVALALRIESVAAAAQLLYLVVLAPFWFLWMGSLLLDEAPATTKAALAPVPPPARRRRRYAFGPALRRWAYRMPSMN